MFLSKFDVDGSAPSNDGFREDCGNVSDFLFDVNLPLTVLSAISLAACAATTGPHCKISDSDNVEAISWRFSSKLR